MILQINEAYPQPRRIEQIVQVLRSEGTIVYPTDTVYGLGCDIHSKKALDRVRRIKKMDNKRPLSFVFADLKQLPSMLKSKMPITRFSASTFPALTHLCSMPRDSYPASS